MGLIIEKIQKGIKAVCVVWTWIGAVTLAMMMVVGTAEPVGMVLRHPVPGAPEFITMGMVVIIFGFLAHIQIMRGHLQVTFLWNRVSPRLKKAFKMLSHLAGFIFFSLLVYSNIDLTWHSVVTKEFQVGIIRIPIYPSRIVLLVGCFLMAVQLVLDLIQEARTSEQAEKTA